jgi:hypothetical protein
MPKTRIIPKSYKLLNSRKFLIGFEVEFLFNPDRFGFEELGFKFQRLHPKIEVVDDCSLSAEDCGTAFTQGMEIITPPLSSKQSFQLLSQVFQLVRRYGKTNSTCGLHLNFSPVSEKMYKSINPFKFTNHPIWEKILKDFEREDCEFCQPVWGERVKPNMLSLFKVIEEGGGYETNIAISKDAAVNFDHYPEDKQEDSHLEIRCFGNKGYPSKLPKIRRYAEQILKLFTECCCA